MSRKLNQIRMNLDWNDLMESFLCEKAAQQRSDRTLKDYRFHIKQFFNRYPNGDLKENLYSYLAEECASATYNLRLVYLKAFFKWCIAEGWIDTNPLSNISQKRAEPRIVDIDLRDLKQLVELPDITTYTGLRDKAMIYLTLDTGIRPSEMCKLSIDDYYVKFHQIIVRAEIAKTRMQRTLPIGPATCNLINRIIMIRPKDWTKSSPLFASCDGSMMHTNAWGDRLQYYSKFLDVKICPYDLRHVFALEFLRNGGNALFLQRILGHTDLTMTKRYVAATNDDLKSALQSASPLNNLVKKTRLRNI
ncbi:hypothetical protein A7K50_03155 [Dehalobacter sp. MCB1]|uniref:tyrosine-type recombinase/integrase n=1 Tax=Dehalobacter sp. MCB1 TaxID=1844756 RepID=UPI000E6BA5C8|nr:tyrosine-type recombinase/integrase [Dehalobacter sp. MCB1]RJE47659.1 hypothetical protein A7K50_03155 [Dehalobacter sp. MCB1]